MYYDFFTEFSNWSSKAESCCCVLSICFIVTEVDLDVTPTEATDALPVDVKALPPAVEVGVTY